MRRTLLFVSCALALLAAGCVVSPAGGSPVPAPTTALPIPGAQPSPRVPPSFGSEVPQGIATVLQRTDIRSATEMAGALKELGRDTTPLGYVDAFAIEESQQVGVPAVIAWWGKEIYQVEAALLAWWESEQGGWQSQPLPVERVYQPVANARMAAQEEAVQLVVFSNSGGSGIYNMLTLYELKEGAWQVVWLPSRAEGWVWNGHVSLRFAGDGIDTVELRHSSWLQEDDPKNHIFQEANPDPHRWFVDTWQKQGSGYVRRQSYTEPSAYNTLVEFVYAIKTDGDAGVWTIDETLVQRAYGLNLTALPLVYVHTLRPWPEGYREGPVFVDFGGRRITFRFAQRDGQYLIAAIEQEPAPTATPDTTRPMPSAPLQTATPTPTTPTFPPLPLYPMALYPVPFAYPFDTLDDAFSGIAYEEMSPVESGVPVAHPIPADLCSGISNWYLCNQAIENHLLDLGTAGVFRQGDRLTIALREGGAVTFSDFRDEMGTVALYTYVGYLPDIAHHLVEVQYYEGSHTLLVNATSGQITVLSGRPVLSPDVRRFIVLAGIGWAADLTVQTWRVVDGGVFFERAWRIEGLPWEMLPGRPVVVWQGEETFEIRWPDSPDSAANRITAQLGPARWEFRYGDSPITRPIVDPDLVSYAPGDGYYRLGILNVGQPVYDDRDYLFTSLPADLVGQPYFLLANNETRRTEADYLRFQVTDRAAVYVALDAAAIELPGWMQAGWEKVDAVLGTDDLPLQLYRKAVSAGTVVLGGNWMPPAAGIRSHYVVIVTPAMSP